MKNTDNTKPITDLARQMLLAGLTVEDAQDLIATKMLAEALRQHGGNQLHVARELHMHRNTLGRYLRHSPELMRTLREIREQNAGSRFARRAQRDGASPVKHLHPSLGGAITDKAA
jgi:hypothetical protein